MKQSLQLRLGQQLTMTPQLQQAIRLLQLSTIELRTEVQDALESNMMLEVDEGADGATAPRNEAPGDGVNGHDSGTDAENVAPVDMPSELSVDSVWDDVYESAPSWWIGGTDEGPELEAQRGTAETLHDHLHWQLGMERLSEVDNAIGEMIVDAIDDDGYLGTDLEEIRSSLAAQGVEVDADEIVAMLRRIQNFDPPGVGARDLAECLQLQILQVPEDTRWRDVALRLVRDHLDVLAARDYAQLMRTLRLEESELSSVIGFIQALSPRPGGQIQAAPSDYVIPDVFVRKVQDKWQVELNPDAFPRLRVNSYYAGLIRRSRDTSDKDTLRTHLQEARWFIKSLRSRSETLLKVATCIVERQRGFFEHGAEAMKPMTLHDVAEVVEMHESTISRVTTRKYMHTPRGIFELKYFFSSHVYTDSGSECSSTAIRALLKKLVAAENPRKPLSDSKLAQVLADQGIKVARRTVAKYRESMSIPPSNERRKLG